MEYEDILEVIRDPKSTDATYATVLSMQEVNEEVLQEIIRRTKEPAVLIKILQSPLMNEELLRLVHKKNINMDSIPLTKNILRSSLLTPEMFNYYLTNIRKEFIGELLNCVYADDNTFRKILKNLDYCLDSDDYIKIIENKNFNQNVADILLSLYQIRNANQEFFIKFVKSPVISDEQFKKICILAHKALSDSIEFFKLIVNDPRSDYGVLSPFISTDGEKIIYVLENNNVNPSIVEQLVGVVNPVSIILKLDDSYFSETVIKALLNRMNNNSNSSSSFYPPSVMNRSNSEIIPRILKLSNLNTDILKKIVKADKYNEFEEAISKNSAYDNSVKAFSIINKSSPSEEELDEFFSLGVSEQDIMELVNAHPIDDVYIRAINYPNATNKLYMFLIDSIFNNKTRSSSNLIRLLLEKDLDEKCLCEIIGRLPTYEINEIVEVARHRNAGLEVSKKLNFVVDMFSKDEDKSRIMALSSEIKDKVMHELFEIEEEEDVTEMLRRNVEDGMSTMLWGASGVGKSSRVFEIDPTATLLILKNGMLPEEVIGGKEPNGEPGKIYKPHWYIVLCRKCEEEPDRKHILFIDEFTNVNDTIKNLVWEVVGNRLVNGHEEWPLPENCSIVVAGNRPEESSAVRIDSSGGVMPAPLHNRIDSMIEIKFDVDEWQKWALETSPKTGNLRIHPIVYSFCMAHCEDCMFTRYNTEDVAQPFLTPRKWETLSDAIYSAERRGKNRHISYDRIFSILGRNNIASAFISHYERLPIDMNKIVMGLYSEEDFASIEDKMYALGTVIAEYDGDPVTIEAFILECLGDEYLSIYNTMKGLRKATLDVVGKGVK